MTSPGQQHLHRMAASLRNGQQSAVQASTRCLERIAQHNGALHAFIAVEREAALRDAQQLDAAAQAGKPMGPHGPE